MISLFATGDFVRVSITQDWYDLGRVGLLMGYALVPSTKETGAFNLYGIVNGERGETGLVAAADMLLDFIYDVERDRFVDRSAKDREDSDGPEVDLDIITNME